LRRLIVLEFLGIPLIRLGLSNTGEGVMRRGRTGLFWRAGALATGLLAATARGQGPIPVNPTGPAPPLPQALAPPPNSWKPLGLHLHDTFLGRPDDFVEPPVGFYVNQQYALMRAKADPHKFMLYRSDFLAGTNRLSPIGASRFNLMANRLPGWLGPVVIEWIPDEPALAESRRAAVLAMLQSTGMPIVPERVVFGPSPYPGNLGADANAYYNNMLTRDAAAQQGAPLSPISSSGFGFGGGSGGAP
jgi:hypothetical protein